MQEPIGFNQKLCLDVSCHPLARPPKRVEHECCQEIDMRNALIVENILLEVNELGIPVVDRDSYQETVLIETIELGKI